MRLVDYGSVLETRQAAGWEALLITATMGEPIIYYRDGLHLDGILAWGAHREYVARGGKNLPPLASSWAEDFELPLAQWAELVPEGAEPDDRLLTTDGKVWGWCASAAITEWVSDSKMEFRRRPAVEEMRRYTGAKSHHLGAGALKAYDLAYPTVFSREVEWFALGHRDRVEALLRLVTHIGKKGRLGMGRVLSWEVDAVDDDRSVSWKGVLTRRMPRAGCPDLSIRAPYHHRSRRLPCAEPGDLV